MIKTKRQKVIERLGIEHFRIPNTKRNWFVIGFIFGYVPYIVHIEGWLR